MRALGTGLRIAIVAALFALAAPAPRAQDPAESKPRLDPLERTEQFPSPQGTSLLADASVLVRVNEARARMNVSGKGLAAIVIDSGVYQDHTAFCGRVALREDFTGDTRADPAADREGHGTHVAGIVAASSDVCKGVASGVHHGMAPAATIYSLKVLNDFGDSDWPWMGAALRRAIEIVRAQDAASGPLIGVVNMSVGSPENMQSDNVADRSGIIAAIRELTTLGVPVVTAAGNRFFQKESVPGMGFPAIVRETISVGAVFNKSYTNASFGAAFATAAKAGQIAPFSQRFKPDEDTALETDLFAPGAEIRSVGILTTTGASLQKGTSQAAPMVSGAILLLQEYYNARRGNTTKLVRAPISDVSRWLKEGSASITDNYGDDDNVTNTGKSYRMLNVLGAMEKLKAEADANKLK
jgi:subtilisin family serine protease